MPSFRIETFIAAPPQRSFDVSRDISFHAESLAHTGERAIAERTVGLIELGESVTWEAKHFGIRQRLTAKITEFDRPHYFRDIMTRGAFKQFAHDHRFESDIGGTRMIDDVTFRSPLGPIGAIVDYFFMGAYLRRLLKARCEAIKQRAERCPN